MGSLQLSKPVFTTFYTSAMIVLTLLQLMGLHQARSQSNADVSQNTHYFFYQNSEYPKDCRDAQRQCSSQYSSGVYLIKPDGFREPFEVFCDNGINSGGWTVIQRRENGIVNFNRSWTQYRDGFGFLSTEFYIGNDKLAYLTNQAGYQLLIEVELNDGCSFNISHKGFRITDEFGEYRLQHLGSSDSIGSQCLSDCPASVFFINDCTEMCSCNESHLNNCGAVSCDVNAMCDVINDIEMCSCKDDYEGDGLRCTQATPTIDHRDCQDVLNAGQSNSGTYSILPDGWTSGPFEVYCEMDNDRGWTVFQRRIDGTSSFRRNWESYKSGFGNNTATFWLGNDKLHHITNQKIYTLRLEVTLTDGTSLNGEYNDFEIGSESTNYTLDTLGSHSGSIGVRLQFFNLGGQFSTYDRDNDGCGNFNCAEGHQSGWWHSNTWCSGCSGPSCDAFPYGSNSCNSLCTFDNLNGVYNGGNGELLFTFNDSNGYCNVQRVEMKIRPTS